MALEFGANWRKIPRFVWDSHGEKWHNNHEQGGMKAALEPNGARIIKFKTKNREGVMKMADFTPIMGTATHNLDSKNRIFIPAKHRESLGSSFVIFPNIKDSRSLVISSVAYLEELMNKIRSAEKLTGKQKAQMINYLNGNGDTLTPDSQGRVVIASSLVSFAGLGGPTVIHGCFDHAEIWAESEFVAATKEDAAEMAELYEEADLI